ncbi:MAG: Ig domain-containing protein [Planctomycetota bacterium]
MRRIATGLAVAIGLIVLTASTALAQPKVLVAGADGDAVLANIEAYLEGTGKFSAVDRHNTSQSLPSLATLQTYDAIVIHSNVGIIDRVTWGNTLVSYVDGGGGVVEMQYCLTASHGPTGNWVNYRSLPEEDAWTNVSNVSKGTVYVNHAIIQNVNALPNCGFGRRTGNVAPIHGAVRIMDWSDGITCLTANETFNGRIACINQYPPSTGAFGNGWNEANNDFDLLVAQALEWCALGGLPKIQSPAAGAMPDGYLTQNYSQTVTAAGGQEPYAWSITSGALPTNLNINSTTGVISGTPTAAGSYAFDVTVTDDNSITDVRSYTIDVYALPQITSPSAGALPDGLINNPYGPVNFTTTGGKAALSWSVIGPLPAGITQNSTTGTLSGTPTAVGNSNFTVRLSDANGVFHDVAYSIGVFDTPVITSPAAGVITPEGYVGAAFSLTFTAAGGIPAYTWSVQSGSLPAGLALNTSTGQITGSPLAAGNNSFTIRVTDTNNDFDQKAYTLQILALPTISSPAPGALPQATRNAPNYSQAFTGTGGKAPLAWSATGLPGGMSLNAGTGNLTGTPTASGAFNINVTLTDANGKTDVDAWTLQVAAAVALTGSSLPDGEEEQAYSATPGNSGGTGPYTWSMFINPALADLTIDPSTGLISGTPTPGTSNNYTVTVTLTDSLGGTANKNYTLYITQPGGGTAANCGCTSSATTRDNAFAGWLMLLLPMLLLVARRRLA